MVCLGLFSDEYRSDATYEYDRYLQQQEMDTNEKYTNDVWKRERNCGGQL